MRVSREYYRSIEKRKLTRSWQFGGTFWKEMESMNVKLEVNQVKGRGIFKWKKKTLRNVTCPIEECMCLKIFFLISESYSGAREALLHIHPSNKA